MFIDYINWILCKLKKKEFWISDYSDKKVLDIGCGSGGRVEIYGKTWSGVELSSYQVKIAKEKGLNVEKGDATKLPFKPDTFDAVISYNVIEHMEPDDAYKHLEEAHKVLHKDGVIILSTPMPGFNFWSTFTHMKPYPPGAIKKITTQWHCGAENYDQVNFKIMNCFYFGRAYFVNVPLISKLIFGFTTLMANLPIMGRYFAAAYIMKLVKA